MVVQHNLTAMNSNRMLGVTTKTQAKSTEKLSSGYKINRAADDAAGLSISEKMRKQIRGLTQASANAQDGISAVQTAEGALTEVHDMLQRMNELAVKAANGTNSEDDRSYIQNEIEQLTTEIDRVAETTKFNETYLLKGNTIADPEYTVKYETDPVYSAASGDGATTIVGSAALGGSGKTVDIASVLSKLSDAPSFTGTGAATLTFTPGATAGNDWTYEITGVTGADLSGTITTEEMEELFGGANGATGLNAVKASDGDTITFEFAVKQDEATVYDKDKNKIAENGLESYFDVNAETGDVSLKAGQTLYDKNGKELTAEKAVALVASSQTKTAGLDLSLHVGADATLNNQISMKIDAMDATTLGIKSLSVSGTDDKNALSAIDTIKAAIQKVSTQRSALGAIQNRLEHTINNLDNVVENTTAAESQIRDTDMATEMVKYSNNNILSQAGQAMLAQANQSNQGVLSLLQ